MFDRYPNLDCNLVPDKKTENDPIWPLGHTSDNLQYNMVGRWVNETIVLPFDGPMFILINYE